MKKKRLFDLSVEGRINITKKNIETGEEVIYPEFHNLLTEWFNRYLYLSGITNVFSDAKLKVGSGSTAPSSSDISLSNENTSWYGGSSYSRYFSTIGRKITFLSKNSISLTHKFVIPATEQAVGILSELGLVYQGRLWYKNQNNNWTYREGDTLLTHSLLKDAEGHPYQIDKGSLDEITVEYTLNFSSQDVNFLQMIIIYAYVTRVVDGITVQAVRLHSLFYQLINAQNQGTDYYVSVSRRIDDVDIVNQNEILVEGTTIINSQTYDTSLLCGDRISSYEALYYSSDGSNVYPSQYYPRDYCTDSSITVSPKRISTKWGRNGHYILFFKFMLSMYNRSISKSFVDLGFTSDTLLDYSIGSGDGVTTDFKPPLNHWKKNTEKIYIDGVLQTRGVDYTCDNDNNLDNLGELTPLFHARVIDGFPCQMDNSYGNPQFYQWLTSHATAGNAYHAHTGTFSSSSISYCDVRNEIIILPRLECGDYDGTTKKYYDFPYTKTGFRFKSLSNQQNFEIGYDQDQYLSMEKFILSTDHPMVFEIPIEKMEELKLNPIVDTIYLWFGNSSQYYTFSVSYSNDGENWTKIVDHQTGYKNSASGRTHFNAYEASLSEWCEYAIGSEVKMKYWKLEMHYNPASTPTSPVYEQSQLGFFIKKKGEMIKFTNAPSNGSIITMDADTDIPYKDSKHVIDIGATFTFN